MCDGLCSCACNTSPLYVSGFSSDTRCRDLKIKSQSVCHLPILQPPLTPIHPAQPGNSKSSSLRLPCLPPSQSLWTFIGERPVGPFVCLQSRDRPIDCCAHARLESSPTAAAAWSDTKVAKWSYTCRSTYTHTQLICWSVNCHRWPSVI